MSALLLQNEAINNYDSAKEQDHLGNHSHRTGYNNPVFVQCNKTGQRQSVFWYPYADHPNTSINDRQSLNRIESRHGNVTFSNFSGAKHDRITTS